MRRNTKDRAYRLLFCASVGERGIPTRCSLADDIKDTTGMHRPFVDDQAIGFSDPERHIRLYWEPKPEWVEWIKAFDGGENPADLPIILRESEATIVPMREKQPRTPRDKTAAKSEPKNTRTRKIA